MNSSIGMDSYWQQSLREDRRFAWILGANLVGAVLVGALLQWLNPIAIPAPPQPEPPRIVELTFNKPPPPPPPPPKPEVTPKPPPPKAKPRPVRRQARPAHGQGQRGGKKQAARAGGSVRDPLADMRKLLGGGTPSTPILTGSAGATKLVSGSVAGAVGNSTVLTKGIGTGSGGIGGQGHGVGLGTGDGGALKGHGTARVGAAALGDGGVGNGGGGRASAEIAAVFRRHYDQFIQSYRQAADKDASIKGGATVVLHLTIEADGSVSACRIVHSSRPNQDLNAGIIAIVRGMHFSPGDREQSDYTLQLLPT